MNSKKRVTVPIYLRRDLVQKINDEAEATNRSTSNLVETILLEKFPPGKHSQTRC